MDILYQDNRIVVIHKPVGVLSTDLPELLRTRLGSDCFRTVHRLDAQVSGLMVLARSVTAAALLSEAIEHHRFTKEYLAVVRGTPPETGTLTDLLGRDRRRRTTFVAEKPGKDVKEASLTYRVIDTHCALSLVRVRLCTGRTHQIRVQFASRGWPLWGDRKYGSAEDGSIALFSCYLRFPHPQTGAVMDFRLLPHGGVWAEFPSLTNGA